ncbi:MAG TPA: glycosyltransferase family 2 protein [Casimicrobiaceae bacterium]|nr:glycosyltransferase family 2 protein [Casimicrobiaceae bacterium]
MKVVIVVPTYNERGNIGPLLEALLAQAARSPHDLHVLVCDDASPDGTAELVLAARRDHPRIHLSPGRRLGLGAAYLRGMRCAMDELGADAVLQMDADFSHDPADVPRLLAALEQDADLVIGSRYVPGGRIPPDWSALRRANSRWGNRVARYLVGLHPIRDCTSGFRAIRSSLLEGMSLDRIRVQGYAFLVAFLYEAKLHGARIAEIPIVFSDRERGASKLGLRDIREFIVNALWLRFRSLATFARFLLVGMSGVAVNLGAFLLLTAAGIDRYAASPLSTLLSMLSNFALHRLWTFRPRRAAGAGVISVSRLGLASLGALLASYGVFATVCFLWPRLPAALAQLASIVPATLINYFYNAYWTARRQAGAAKAAAAADRGSRARETGPEVE